MKKLITVLLLLIAFSFSQGSVLADQIEEEVCIETTVYGGGVGVVCGVKTQEPVDTVIADNPLLFGAVLLIASGLLFLFSKRLKAEQIA